MGLFNKKKKKIILMDIDGVLSPLSRVDEPYSLIKVPWATFAIPDYTLDYLKTNLMKLRGFTWSSSWENSSNAINKYLGVPNSPFIHFPDDMEETLWFKDKYLVDFCLKNCKQEILIVDDSIPKVSKLRSISNVTLIIPDPLYGLSEDDFNRITSWLSDAY